MSIYSEIPGLLEAVEREQFIRNLPLTGLPEVVAGVDVLPMTIRHLAVLESVRCPIVSGGEFGLIDLLRFLWILSPQYKVGSVWRRRLWVRRTRRTLKDKLWVDICASVRSYMDETWLDAPGSSGSDSGVPPCSFAGYFVHYFAYNYGWTPETTLSTPIKTLWQCRKLIHMKDDPDAHAFNRLSDKVKTDWMTKQNS